MQPRPRTHARVADERTRAEAREVDLHFSHMSLDAKIATEGMKRSEGAGERPEPRLHGRIASPEFGNAMFWFYGFEFASREAKTGSQARTIKSKHRTRCSHANSKISDRRERYRFLGLHGTRACVDMPGEVLTSACIADMRTPYKVIEVIKSYRHE